MEEPQEWTEQGSFFYAPSFRSSMPRRESHAICALLRLRRIWTDPAEQRGAERYGYASAVRWRRHAFVALLSMRALPREQGSVMEKRHEIVLSGGLLPGVRGALLSEI